MSLLGGLNNFAGSLGFGGGNQGFQQSPMDQGSQDQINSYMNNTNQSAQDQQNNILAGTQRAAPIASQGADQQRVAASEGGGGMPGMQQAISARAAKNFGIQQGKTAQSAQLSGAVMANNQYNVAAQNSVAYMNAQNQVEQKTNALAIAQNAATYSTVSGFMAGAGTFAGTYAAEKQSGYDKTPKTGPNSASSNDPFSYDASGGGEADVSGSEAEAGDSAAFESAGESGIGAEALA